MSLQESDKNFLIFQYHCQNKFFLHHKYAMKGLYKEFALQGSSVDILWINEVGGTCKRAFNFPKIKKL